MAGKAEAGGLCVEGYCRKMGDVRGKAAGEAVMRAVALGQLQEKHQKTEVPQKMERRADARAMPVCILGFCFVWGMVLRQGLSV